LSSKEEGMTERGKLVWIGRVVSALPALLFLFSATLKVMGGPDLEKGFAGLQLPLTMRIPLAVIEASCTLVYLIPYTAVLGAILLTGFLGGAMLTHWRVGEPVYLHIVIGVLVWLGIWLRDSRLRALIPLRQR
jgi:hypothetical protein